MNKKNKDKLYLNLMVEKIHRKFNKFNISKPKKKNLEKIVIQQHFKSQKILPVRLEQSQQKTELSSIIKQNQTFQCQDHVLPFLKQQKLRRIKNKKNNMFLQLIKSHPQNIIPQKQKPYFQYRKSRKKMNNNIYKFFSNKKQKLYKNINTDKENLMVEDQNKLCFLIKKMHIQLYKNQKDNSSNQTNQQSQQQSLNILKNNKLKQPQLHKNNKPNKILTQQTPFSPWQQYKEDINPHKSI